jgi:hypothetical protein
MDESSRKKKGRRMMRPVLLFILLAGTSMAQGSPESPPSGRDRFFDPQNLALLGSLTVWHGLDAYTTEQTIDQGGRETWPVARHFCGSRNSRIAYFGTNYASTIAGSYLLHRAGHRKLARAVLMMGNISSASGYTFTLAHTGGLAPH